MYKHKRMKVIGITGGIACGKSEVSNYLKSLGYPILDADEEVRALYDTQETRAFVLHHFGTLDRLKLREIVFNNSSKKGLLEHHLHPRVYRNILLSIQKHQREAKLPLLFVVIPLLFESRNLYPFDSVCCVSCHEDQQLQRITQRDQHSLELAKNIIRQQLPLAYKQSQSNYIIHNNSNLQDLHADVDVWLKSLLA